MAFILETRTLKGYHDHFLENLEDGKKYAMDTLNQWKGVDSLICTEEIINESIEKLEKGISKEEVIWYFDDTPIYLSLKHTEMDEADYNEMILAREEAEMEMYL